MSILQKLELELNGIVFTILNYTSNPYIVGYTNILKKYLEQKDLEMVRLVLFKLSSWYDDEIEVIKSNVYVHNKEEHIKTMILIQNTIKELSPE